MGIILKLLHGPDQLDLMSGRYCVDEGDFRPPTAAKAVTYGAASVGSVATSRERVNRVWAFTVNIVAGTNEAEAERALRELQSFLNRAGGATPLYVAYRAWNDYTFEPFFGLHGAFARYEVAYGTAEVGGGYRPAVDTGYILNVNVRLTIKPQAVYLPQPSGQAIGGIFEDYIGTVGGRPRGTVISEATTNKMTNPAFMAATWNTGWTASVIVASENKDPNYILFGNTSAMLQNATPAAGSQFTQSINVGNTSTHTISYYIKREDGGAVTTSTARIWYGGTITPDAAVAVGNGWYRVYADVTGVNAATDTGVQLPGSTFTHFVDGVQIEQKDPATPFVYGDMLDCTWAGTKNASTSTRVAGRLRYQYTEILNRLTQYTLRVVWLPFETNLRASQYLCEDSDDDLGLWLDSSERYNFSSSSGASIQSAAVTLVAGTPEIIHVTFDGDTATVYRNGASLVSGTIAENATLPTYLYVGSSDDATLQLNCPIMGFATFQRSMTAAEVSADYVNCVQQVTDGDRLDPLPWVFTEDGDNIVDNDNDGTLNNYCIVGGLMGDDVDVAYKLDSSNSFVLGPGVTWGSLPVDQRLFDKDILTTGGTNTLLFKAGAGTADADANNNAVTRISLSTSTTASMETTVSAIGAQLLREAKSVAGYFVVKDTSTNTNVQVQMQIQFGDNSETFYESAWRTIATSNAFRPFITAELPLDFDAPLLDSSRKMGFRFRFKRLAGSATENFDISHAIWLVNHSTVYTATVGNTVAVDMCYVRDLAWEGVDDAVPTLTIGRRTFNRPLYIRPEYLNVLMLQHSADNFAAATTVWTSGYNLEIEQFVVTPRFDIL